MSRTEQQDGWLHWAERRAGLHGPDDGRDDDSVFMALSLSPSLDAHHGAGYNDIKWSGESGSSFGGYREQGLEGRKWRGGIIGTGSRENCCCTLFHGP